MVDAVAHNGGRSQVNFNFLFNSGEYPFLNMFKTADPVWSGVGGVSANSPITPDMLDSDGYPTTLTNTLGTNFGSTGGIYTQVIVAPQSSRPGNWVITWDGNGTIYAIAGSGSITTVSGSKTSAAGAGRYVFSTTTNNFLIGIASIGSPRITNIKLFHADDETALLAGEVFGAKFKERLAEGKFGVLRFLNWMNTNNTNLTNWFTRKPQSYVWYCGAEMRSALYAGVTTNSGNSYSVGFPSIHSSDGTAWSSGGPKDKDTIHVVFNASATTSGTCDLNVGSTGALNILGSDSGPLSTATTRYPTGGTYQSIATLVFDATLNAWIKRGGDIAGGPQGLYNGVPPELLLQLCREVGAHPSFPIPYFTLTPATDYLPKLIELIQSTCPSWMIPYFEGTNELWNPIFLGTGYANAMAGAYGWTAGDYQNWYGKTISVIGQIASAMYGADRTKYRVLCGVQTGTGTSLGGVQNSNPRLSSAKYVNNTGGLQSAQALTGSWGTINISASVGVAEAWRWATHVTVVNYVAPGLYGTTTGTVNEADLATAFAGGDLDAPGRYLDSIIPANSIVTFTNGTPGEVNWTAHGRAANEPVYFRTTGGLPAGVSTAGHFVKTVLDADRFTVATSVGGTAVNMSGTYTGTVRGFAATNAAAIPAMLFLQQNWKTWAQGFGIQRMCGYEGGYSPDYTGGGSSSADLLRAAGKLVTSSPGNSLGMLGYTQVNYYNFLSLSDGTFTAEFPSCFQFGGKTPSANVWSVLEDVYMTTSPPQFEAIRLFNNRLRRHGLVATP